jgi:trehalose 6-phosphate phosphatase
MDPAELIAAIRTELDRALIALDFDGTLAPIVPNPGDARPLPGAVEAMTELARRGAQMAIITGRDAETAVRLGGLHAVPDLVVAGLYGAEWWRAGQLSTPSVPPVIGELRPRLAALLASAHTDPAVWIEDKRLSLVVHARRAADPAAALTVVRQPVERLADELGLEVHPGRGVLELRLPGSDKGTALHRLVDEFRPERVLFVGDDLGDLPAFEATRALRAGGMAAWSVGVGSAEVPQIAEAADVLVDGPAAAVTLLQALSS